MPTEHQVEINATATTKSIASTGTGRDAESWNFFWIMLGLLLSIEGTLIQLSPPHCPLLTFVLLGLATCAAFLAPGGIGRWVRNKTIGLKNYLESSLD